MTSDPSTQLLKEIGRFIGIEEIVFNEEGLCTLQLQEKYSFIVRHDRPGERLVMLVEIAPVEHVSSELFSKILGFNFIRAATPGPWIALEEKSKMLFLADEYPLATTRHEELKDRLVLFFEQYLALQGLCNAETMEALPKNKE